MGDFYLLTPTHLGLIAHRSLTYGRFFKYAQDKTGQVVLVPMLNRTLFGRRNPINNVKKMCSLTNLTPENRSARVQQSTMSGVSAALQYTPPVYRETQGCSFIEFYAYDPEMGNMRRKRIKTNRIKGVLKRRQYVRDLIKRICEQLHRGWNPWIAGKTQ